MLSGPPSHLCDSISAYLFDVMIFALIKIGATHSVAASKSPLLQMIAKFQRVRTVLLPVAEYSDFLLRFNFSGSRMQKVLIDGRVASHIFDLLASS